MNKYIVSYQRKSDMVITWIIVDAKYEEQAKNISKKMLKSENILNVREV